MAKTLDIHLDHGSLQLGPVKPQGDHKLDALMERLAQRLNESDLFSRVSLTEPADRTYRIEADWPAEVGRMVFGALCEGAMLATEFDPDIDWGGP